MEAEHGEVARRGGGDERLPRAVHGDVGESVIREEPQHLIQAGLAELHPHAFHQSIGKENLLRVYGPTLTETITERILGENGAFAHDWKARVNHPLSQRVHANRGGTLPRKPPSVLAKDVGPGMVHEGREWRATAAPAEHVQPWLDSLAYRLDTAEGSIVLTGDTQPCQTVVELARGADMMLCMCWDDQDRMEAIGENLGQCGTIGAAQMAQQAGVKKLVLVHVGPHLASHGPMEKGIGDVRKVYEGEIIFAEELMSLRI